MALSPGDQWRRHKTPHRRTLRSLPHRHPAIEHGLWYDYPECCVREFATNMIPIRMRHRDIRIVCRDLINRNPRHQGICVPCLPCARKYLQERNVVLERLRPRSWTIYYRV